MSESDGIEDEAPLDPATERLRRKMVRLLAVSIGIMFVGLMAVLIAVVYRTGAVGGLEPGASVPLALPAGSTVAETSLDGDRLALRLENADGGSEIVIVDVSTGAILTRHPLAQ